MKRPGPIPPPQIMSLKVRILQHSSWLFLGCYPTVLPCSNPPGDQGTETSYRTPWSHCPALGPWRQWIAGYRTLYSLGGLMVKGPGWVLRSILLCWKRSFSTNEKKWNPGDEWLRKKEETKKKVEPRWESQKNEWPGLPQHVHQTRFSCSSARTEPSARSHGNLQCMACHICFVWLLLLKYGNGKPTHLESSSHIGW